MIKVLFVCHGNICRSPMAEMIFKELLRKEHQEQRYSVSSCATSTEELGSPLYPPARDILQRNHIPVLPHRARQISRRDCEEFDYILVMDARNLRNIAPFIGDNQHKVHRLLDFSQNPRDISDPWYTRDFQLAFDDILEGCQEFLARNA